MKMTSDALSFNIIQVCLQRFSECSGATVKTKKTTQRFFWTYPCIDFVKTPKNVSTPTKGVLRSRYHWYRRYVKKKAFFKVIEIRVRRKSPGKQRLKTRHYGINAWLWFRTWAWLVDKTSEKLLTHAEHDRLCWLTRAIYCHGTGSQVSLVSFIIARLVHSENPLQHRFAGAIRLQEHNGYSGRISWGR